MENKKFDLEVFMESESYKKAIDEIELDCDYTKITKQDLQEYQGYYYN